MIISSMGGWWVAGVGVEEGYGVIVEGTVDKFCLVCCFMMKKMVCLFKFWLSDEKMVCLFRIWWSEEKMVVCIKCGGLKKRWLFVQIFFIKN